MDEIEKLRAAGFTEQQIQDYTRLKSAGFSPDEIDAHFTQPRGPEYGFTDAVAAGIPGALKLGAATDVLVDKALGRNPAPFSEAYMRRVAEREAERNAYLQQHPVLGRIEEGVGGALGLRGLPTAPTSALGKVAVGAGTGAGVGAAEAASHAQPGDELSAAAPGAVAGALAGGVLSGAGAALSAGWQRLVPGQQAQAVRLLLQTPGIGDDPAVVAALSNQKQILEHRAALLPADGPTLLAKLRGGDDLDNALVQIAQRSPAARLKMEQAAARAAHEAKPLYNAAYEQSVNVTPPIASALKDPEVQVAYKAAAEELGRRGIHLPALGEDGTPLSGAIEGLNRQLGGASSILQLAKQMNPSLLNKPGNEVFKAALEQASAPVSLPVEAIDLIKRNLQATINREPTNAADYASQQTTRRLLKGLMAETDAQVPAFAQAREIAAGGARLKTAIAAGRAATTKDVLEGAMKPLLGVTPMEGGGMAVGVGLHHPGAMLYYPAKVLAALGIRAANRAVANRVGGAATEILTSPALQGLARLAQPADAAGGMVSHLFTPAAAQALTPSAPAAPAAPAGPTGSPSLVDLLRLKFLTGGR